MKKIDYLNNIESLIKKENFKDAEILCLEILPKYEDTLIYYFLGICQKKLKKIDLAIYNLKKSIFLDHGLLVTDARNILGNIYIEKREFNLAEDIFRKLVSINDKYEEYQIGLINTLILQKKSNQVMEELDKALEKFPKSKKLKKLKDSF